MSKSSMDSVVHANMRHVNNARQKFQYVSISMVGSANENYVIQVYDGMWIL